MPQGPGSQQRRQQEKLRHVLLDSDEEMQEAAAEEARAHAFQCIASRHVFQLLRNRTPAVLACCERRRVHTRRWW